MVWCGMYGEVFGVVCGVTWCSVMRLRVCGDAGRRIRSSATHHFYVMYNMSMSTC